MVLYLHFPLIRPQPKWKFAIFCGCTPRPAFLFINTEINDFVKQSPHLVKDHLPIKLAEHTEFLSYDSWVDCTELIGFDEGDLRKCAVAAQKGMVCDAMLKQITECIAASALIPEKKKKFVIEALTHMLPVKI